MRCRNASSDVVSYATMNYRRSAPRLSWRSRRSAPPTGFSLLIALALLAGLLAPTQALRGAAQPQPIFLPLLIAGEDFGSLPALWTHADPPAIHEVVLLRCRLNLATPLSEARLDLFADTRYELWLNGSFVGRGPARFSSTRREYDRVALDSLPAGPQTIAIQAQWAPNLRRSTSIRPEIQARLSGQLAGTGYEQALSPEACRILSAEAWNRAPAPVHSWNLLGPVEQLDLRLLPSNWASPDFDDSSWPRPVVRATLNTTSYQPRSILPLANVPIRTTLHAVGQLAPGFWVGELGGTAAAPTSYRFTLSEPTLVTLQALVGPGQPDPATAISLNGASLAWSAVPQAVPDLRRASQSLPAGEHELQLIDTTAQPWVFAISNSAITSPPPPLGQGNNPGRRLLIPTLQSDPQAVTVISTTQGLELSFGSQASYAILDLGRTVHGRLVAEVSGPAGGLIDIGWDERLWQGERPLPHPGSLHPEWSQADAWLLDNEPRTLSTIDSRSGRYILIAAWGQGNVQLRNLRVFEERYPLTLRGSFVSPNERLNRIWNVGVATLYPSMVDAYADPWRERGQWWGDAHIADRMNRVSFGETALLRRGLQQIADGMTGGMVGAFEPNANGFALLDYAMLWVQSADDYGRMTGDWVFVSTLYPQIRTVMASLASLKHPESGLIDLSRVPTPSWSAYIDSNSYWDRRGQTTAINAFYYRTLHAAASLATHVGQPEEVSAWQTEAEAIRSRANQLLYLADEGRYAAGSFNGRLTPATPQAQATALAFGLAPEGEAQRIADSMLSMLGSPELPGLQILGMFYLLEGLGQLGRVDDALLVIDHFFGSMLDRGATTWWENFHADQNYTSSLSHAWGSSPGWFLSTYALGARIVGPDQWQVQLNPSSLTSLSGVLPLAQGNLALNWQVGACRQISLQINAPTGSTGEVRLPLGSTTTQLWLNEALRWQSGQGTDAQLSLEPGWLVIQLGPGEQQLDLRPNCS